MSAEKTSLVNKLILLVLVLILACLVVLIARQNSAGRDETSLPVTQIVAEENSAPAQPEPPKPLPLTNRASRKATLPVTQPAARAAEEPPASQLEVSRLLATQPPVSTHLVNLPSRSSSATPISSTSGNLGNGAQIVGYVWLKGTPPPETPITLDATCGRLHTNPITTRHYLRTEDGRLANVFVHLQDTPLHTPILIPTNAAVMDNINCLFEPYVLGVQTHQKVQFRNSDPFLHNVQASSIVPSPDDQGFNVALPNKERVIEKSFRHAEVFMRVKCDVHPWMFAYIGVMQDPFFAVTDSEGFYRLPANLPPGNHTLVAHHPKAGNIAQRITIHAGETLRLDFTLPVRGK